VGIHDKAFKALMAEPGALEALLRERLPRRLVRRFAGPPRRLSETFIEPSLRAAMADVVAEVELRGGERALVYCLIEHKRRRERYALVQMLRYEALLYTQLEKQAKGGKLPPVIGLLVYNGSAPWTGPRRFSALVDAPDRLGGLVLDFRVAVLDLGSVGAASLSRHPTLKGGLLALKAAAEVEPGAQLALIKEAISLLAEDDSTLALFLRYLEGVAGRRVLRMVMQAVREVAPEKEAQVQTIADYYRSQGARRGLKRGLAKGLARGLEQGLEQGREQGLEQGREQGLEQGREQGLEQGREQGLRVALKRLLTKRFKRVPPRVNAKLADADAAVLQRWLDEVLDAHSLEALFPRG
jgi:hypothetical protein